MVDVDSVRRRVRLSEAELVAAQAGALSPAGQPGWVAQLLAIVAAPALRVQTEVLRVQTLAYPTWGRPTLAVHGEPGADGSTDLVPIEPFLVPYVIAQQVGFWRRPPAAQQTPIQILASRFAALERQPEQGDGDRDGAMVSQVLRQRQASWRVSAVWADLSDRRHTDSLQVLDAGTAGLWTITVPEPDTVDPLLVLTPTRASAVWRALIRLLPTRRPEAEPNVGAYA